MLIFGDKYEIKFLASTLIMLQFYILFITVFYLIGYPVLEMIYCIPIIAFLQLLQYLCFWKPKDNCFPCFLICNTCFFVISFALFVGIFLGIFNQTLQYHFQEVQECKVIGKFSTFLLEFPYYSSEKYSALYVDFQMDGQQFLGYGCLSSSTEETNPTGMFAHNPLIFQYYGQQQSYDSYKSLPYEFSQVKLPSWMCIPFDTDYEELVKTKNCYVHFFNSGKGQTKDQAFLNSKNRLNVRDLQSFALISFKELNAPFNQYFCFLVFSFCPLISTTNILFIGLIGQLEKYIKKISNFNKKYTINKQNKNNFQKI